MTDKELILTVSRIAQEFCNVLPQEAVLFFAEGLRRRHNCIPDKTQCYLDALANIVQQVDLDPPQDRRPTFRLIRGGAA
jgi:hypothetical protein